MKEASLFANGGSQALRIPKEMRFKSEKVYVEKIGSIMVVLDESDQWASLKLAQQLFAGSFMSEGRNVNPIVERDGLKKDSK